jgi:hypothetical protein
MQEAIREIRRRLNWGDEKGGTHGREPNGYFRFDANAARTYEANVKRSFVSSRIMYRKRHEHRGEVGGFVACWCPELTSSLTPHRNRPLQKVVDPLILTGIGVEFEGKYSPKLRTRFAAIQPFRRKSHRYALTRHSQPFDNEERFN